MPPQDPNKVPKDPANSQDPSLTPDPIQPEFTICHDCKANLPITEFGLAKYSRSGRSYICRACRSQYLRLSRQHRLSSLPRHPDLVIRSVYGQNLGIIHTALAQGELSCMAFVPHTDKRYKVHFGRSRYDFPSMAIFNMDGSNYQEYAYSNIPQDKLLRTLTDLLKEHDLRLELDEAGIQLSKQLIYFY